VPLAALALGIVLQRVASLGVLAHLPLLGRAVLGGGAAAAGIALAVSANRTFARIGTNVLPSKPALALATTGVFARTRNPIYVGNCLLLLGIALGFALDWALLLLAASLPLLHRSIVLHEERYLEGKFGEEYRRYKARVPRYGGPV
jgi:protein-S-isoprenylcysteine O-methyltransferase Ste14